MRDAINSNPVVQAAVIGVLLLGTAFFFLSSTGGGEEEESAAPETTLSVTEGAPPAAPTGEVPSVPLAATLDAPPLPRAVTRAYEANQTVVLLFVRSGGIDDTAVRLASTAVAGMPQASLFVVPAGRISRYAAITGRIGVDRVPALVVLSPKELKKTVPTASLSYGFQSSESVVQAVIDAGYKGPTVDYHP